MVSTSNSYIVVNCCPDNSGHCGTMTNFVCHICNISSIKVGVLDTGVDVDHPDLLQNISPFRFYPNLGGTDVTDVTDEVGHGTTMAGIIGATVDNDIGIAGTNHFVEILPAKLGGGEPAWSETNVALAFEWLMSRVQVINMSFGMGYLDENIYLPNEYLRQAREDYAINLVEVGR